MTATATENDLWISLEPDDAGDLVPVGSAASTAARRIGARPDDKAPVDCC